MSKKRRRSTIRLVVISVIAGVFLLTVGPVVINYIFAAESLWLNIAFDAGNLLDYYGAVLGGLVTCFAIIVAIQMNNQNLREERERAKLERAYEVYHKLPEMLTKLDSSAIHLQYSAHISESALMETLDAMDECDGILREQHFMNERFYNKTIDALLKNIADASAECQSVAERFLIEKENAPEDYEPPHAELEASSTRLREAIGKAKNEITSEINKFIYGNED